MRNLLTAAVLTTGVLSGCEKPKKAKPTTPATETAPAPAPSGGGGGTGYQSGAGVAQNVRNAARRTVVMNDLNQIRLYIETASLASGVMPSANDTYAALKKEAPAIATLIDEKAITLHPARTRAEVWAYETAALTSGGLVCTSSGVERMEAAVLKQRLGQ